MKSRLIFRILGALASALIIVSVFIPFISVTGYSISLWQTFESTKSLYLPIMIIVFGAIGLIFFAINFKTEFAYMSTGAILFFLVMQTFDVLKQDAFGSLSVGYYCLAVGSILTGVMALLSNLKPKVAAPVVVASPAPVAAESVLNKIDSLYDNQTLSQGEMSINPLDTISPIQPNLSTNILPISGSNVTAPSIDNSSMNQTNQSLNEFGSASQTSTPVSQEFTQPIPVVKPAVQEMAPVAQPVKPVMQEFTQSAPVVNPVVQEMASVAQPVKPVMQEFTQSAPVVNPVVQEMAPVAQPVNPVMQEFTQPAPVANPVIQVNSSETAPSNLTVQEFTKEMSNNYEFVSVAEEKEPDNKLDSNGSNQSSVSVSNINNVGQINQNQPASSGLDIFGQPIN